MFREKFKYYKKKDPPPSFEEVIKVAEPNVDILSELTINCDDDDVHECDKYGLRHPSMWNIYELKSCPGFIYIVNPFTSSGQRYWVCRSLADYTKKPSVTNIDGHKDVVELLKHDKWWDIVSSNSKHSHQLKKKLRWATMGYHHNWDTKIYSESSKDPFPKDLDQLCVFIIKTVLNMDFRAEACIVNFYHMDSSLSGHTDRSEPNREAPLLSFSFGQSAIFLIGGTTLEERPNAILVESGDIAIMFGDSRLRYHGVPRILRASRDPWNNFQHQQQYVNQSISVPELSCGTYPITSNNLIADADSWAPFSNYLNDSRININVRQVLSPNQTSLGDAQK
ncbi:nucleic acid dioxygenase ALKBH1 [Planococcus citri]|uniref:nucleic acid dioxygenase ALKBH1 n=1 Tax=Planococcus citri TaxID=170843 RepID=UPI0031F872F4